jgi:adenylyl-sulfate kinase
MSGAGKTTLARRLETEIRRRDLRTELLDGDWIRENLSKGLGFTKPDRDLNVRRVGFVCNLLRRNGVFAIAALISPYRESRQTVRRDHPPGSFVEIFVDCPLQDLIARDTKGLYKRAIRGEIANFTGISDPYEPPENPEITLHTNLESEEESFAKIIRFVEKNGWFKNREFQ